MTAPARFDARSSWARCSRGLAAAWLVAFAALAASAASDRVHVVQAGETLWQITENAAGDPYRWPEVYRANRDQIKDPGTLYPGQRLAIPDFPARAPGATESQPPLRPSAQ